MPRRWIVISLDGLATAAIGAYGSSWNETPSIDRMASRGTVIDRAICTHDDSVAQLKSLWTERIGDLDFVTTFKQHGRVELFVNAGDQAAALSQLADQLGFDQCTVVETVADDDRDASQDASLSMDDIEDASLAQWLLPVLERLNDNESPESRDWSLLWVHGDTLTRCWDAPRWLFPVDDEDDEDDEPIDQVEWMLSDFEAASTTDEPGDAPEPKPPAMFEGTEVPRVELNEHSHPDLVTSWMQTYGCQVRLLDRMMELLLSAIENDAEPIGVAILGTSGFSLGQNGWIGHRVGPIRTPQLHVPIVLFDGEPASIRLPGLKPLEASMHMLSKSFTTKSTINSSRDSQRISPIEWSREDSLDIAIATKTARAEHVLTTPQWFFVEESGVPDGARLYLKPDDRDDMNDVADRCRDVVDAMRETLSAPRDRSV